MHILRTIGLLLAVLAIPAAAQAPQELQPAPLAPRTAAAASPVPAVPSAAPALTAADVSSWLDGFMPYAIQSGDLAGAVVVVVKDGQIVTERGFGYADVKSRKPVDPKRTLFRPGSTSKLFTWTAVMQLVQAGKLDLNRDINDYLDFKIPPAFGKPITLRNLMTHTAGFEETAKYLITEDPKQNTPLDVALKRWVPTRIFAPGAVPAYSNYGASLAGYIVQRVSGEPFDQYVQRHIMAPIGMTRSTFAQPLPPALRPDMATGYNQASQEPQKFEIIPLAPAGALSATGDDMARFMIAHLNHGGPLLNPQTAQLMYATADRPIPGLSGMALGFYHEDRNGRTIIGHGGDTVYFHSDLHLYLDDGVGIFVSFNSAGKEGAAHRVRSSLFEQFTDRYFPAPDPWLPTASTAHAHGAAMVGHYDSTRGARDNFLKLVALLGQAKVTLNSDDTISASMFVNAAGVPKRWREVGPWQWHEVGGKGHLNAVVKDGKVQSFLSDDIPTILLLQPVSASMNAGWIIPVTLAALAVMLIAALGWPIVALVRRSYAYRPGLAGRPLQLHRATRITAWLMVAIAVGWTVIVSLLDIDLTLLNGGLDIWMRLLQLIELVAIVGAALSVWNAYVVVRSTDRRWPSKLWAVIIALAALFLVWLLLSMNTLTWSLDF